MLAEIVPAAATTITITVASDCPFQPKPTIIVWRKEKGFWQRYWSGYDRDGSYTDSGHDWGAKGPPDSEVGWANQVGHEVDFK